MRYIQSILFLIQNITRKRVFNVRIENIKIKLIRVFHHKKTQMQLNQMKNEFEMCQQHEKRLIEENIKLTTESNQFQQQFNTLENSFKNYQIETTNEKEQFQKTVCKYTYLYIRFIFFLSIISDANDSLNIIDWLILIFIV